MSTATARAGPGGVDGAAAIAGVAGGTLTAAALYEDAMRRIFRWEPALGAVVDRLEYRPPPEGPLRGMVLGVKNHIDVAGCRNWRGLQGRGVAAEPVARDARVVTRLRNAGAQLACTTAAPFLGGPGGVTPQTRNARSLDRVSGGSSGGSASAIAAGLVHAALGTDAGGSIRIPAACCGIVGLQTTRGLVPLTGVGTLTYSMDNVGPMASTVGDVRRVLDVIAGYDPEDPYSIAVGPPRRWDGSPLRIGLPTELVDWNIDVEVAEAFDRVVAVLRDAGHYVERVSLPILRESMELGPGTVGIVESGTIIEDEFAAVLEQSPELLDAVRRSKEISGPMMARTYHRVAVLRCHVRRLFADYDVLVTPTLPCRIPAGSAPHLEAMIEVGGAIETRTSALTRLVNPWNLAAVPAGSQPVWLDQDGAPVSVQVIGPPLSDWKVLDVMESIEAALGGPLDTAAPPDQLSFRRG